MGCSLMNQIFYPLLKVSLLNGVNAPVWSRQQVWFVFVGWGAPPLPLTEEPGDAQSVTVIKTPLCWKTTAPGSPVPNKCCELPGSTHSPGWPLQSISAVPVPLIFTGPSGGHFRESPLALHAAVPGLWHFQTHQPKTHAGLFYLMGIFIYPLIKYLAAAIILANECEQDPSVFNAWVLLFISQPHHTIPALI